MNEGARGQDGSPASRLEIRHLQVIDAVQRLGSVTAAARSLHLTQPAVSHALREIERRLGVAIVVPRGRGVAPTALGTRLARRARAILAALAEAEHEARDAAAEEGARLRLTTECYTCYHWLPRALAELRRRVPALQLELVPEATRAPHEALLAGQVDLAIVHQRLEHADLEHVALFRDEMVVIVPADHRLATRPFVAPEDFAEEHLVLHGEPERSAVVVDVLAPAGVSPARVSTLQLTEALVETVKAGLGITVLARWAVAPQLQDGSLRAVPLTENGLTRGWWAATPRAAARTGAAELIELLRERGLA